MRTVRFPRELIQLARAIGAARAVWLSAVNAWAHVLCRLGVGSRSSSVSVRVHGVPHPLTVRAATSDYGVFKQIFLEREYAPLDDIEDPRLIVDCGANVGYSSAYFLSRFPGARVIAVEPDPANVEICRRNLAGYGDRAVVLAKAVWPRSTRLTLLHYGDLGDCGESGVQVCESSAANGGSEWPEHVHRGPNPPVPSGEVDAESITAITRMAGGIPIDLLKMDIEKAELEIFRDPDREWLSNVRNIAIELHGSAARDAFADALRPYRHDSMESGELTICRNIAPTATATGAVT